MKKKIAIIALALMMAAIPVMAAPAPAINSQSPCEQMMNGNLPGMMNYSRKMTGNVGSSGLESSGDGTGWFSLPFLNF